MLRSELRPQTSPASMGPMEFVSISAPKSLQGEKLKMFFFFQKNTCFFKPLISKR